MALLLYILVIIGALFVIASGIWVAIALAKVVSTKQPASPGGLRRATAKRSENGKT